MKKLCINFLFMIHYVYGSEQYSSACAHQVSKPFALSSQKFKNQQIESKAIILKKRDALNKKIVVNLALLRVKNHQAGNAFNSLANLWRRQVPTESELFKKKNNMFQERQKEQYLIIAQTDQLLVEKKLHSEYLKNLDKKAMANCTTLYEKAIKRREPVIQERDRVRNCIENMSFAHIIQQNQRKKDEQSKIACVRLQAVEVHKDILNIGKKKQEQELQRKRDKQAAEKLRLEQARKQAQRTAAQQKKEQEHAVQMAKNRERQKKQQESSALQKAAAADAKQKKLIEKAALKNKLDVEDTFLKSLAQERQNLASQSTCVVEKNNQDWSRYVDPVASRLTYLFENSLYKDLDYFTTEMCVVEGLNDLFLHNLDAPLLVKCFKDKIQLHQMIASRLAEMHDVCAKHKTRLDVYGSQLEPLQKKIATMQGSSKELALTLQNENLDDETRDKTQRKLNTTKNILQQLNSQIQSLVDGLNQARNDLGVQNRLADLQRMITKKSIIRGLAKTSE